MILSISDINSSKISFVVTEKYFNTLFFQVSKLEQQQTKMREEKDTAIKELQEQLQDIMLYLEAQEKCKNTELEGGQVVIGPSASHSSESHKGAKNKKRAK